MRRGHERTLRLIMPQWQGGNGPDYYVEAHLLAWLAPVATGPVETVLVPEPKPGDTLAVEHGMLGRAGTLGEEPPVRPAATVTRRSRRG